MSGACCITTSHVSKSCAEFQEVGHQQNLTRLR
jgi:hypothetical protein